MKASIKSQATQSDLGNPEISLKTGKETKGKHPKCESTEIRVNSDRGDIVVTFNDVTRRGIDKRTTHECEIRLSPLELKKIIEVALAKDMISLGVVSTN